MSCLIAIQFNGEDDHAHEMCAIIGVLRDSMRKDAET